VDVTRRAGFGVTAEFMGLHGTSTPLLNFSDLTGSPNEITEA
jgi:hypothetical protein